jgi:carbonic anhydrase
MRKLVSGVHRFRRQVYEPNRALYQSLVDGQQPHTLFITCSDSRLSTEALTQTGPGELFVLRNAGNLVPPYGSSRGGEAATLEYALAGLNVRHIVICGHTGCGAMRALLEPESLDGLPETARWLRHAEATRRITEARAGSLSAADLWDGAVEVNVLVQLENMRTHPAVAAALSRGGLKLYGWVFDIRSGEVRNFNPLEGRFVPLPDDPATAGDLPTALTQSLMAAPLGFGPHGFSGANGDLATHDRLGRA